MHGWSRNHRDLSRRRQRQSNSFNKIASLSPRYPITRMGSNQAFPKPRKTVRSSHPANRFCTPPLLSFDIRLIVDSTLSFCRRSFLYLDDPAILFSVTSSEGRVGKSMPLVVKCKSARQL